MIKIKWQVFTQYNLFTSALVLILFLFVSSRGHYLINRLRLSIVGVSLINTLLPISPIGFDWKIVKFDQKLISVEEEFIHIDAIEETSMMLHFIIWVESFP